MMLVKVHVVDEKKLVAVCDADLLGKKVSENGLQLDLTGNYYRGDAVTEAALPGALKGALSATFIGKESVSAAIKAGFIEKENVRTVLGIPHAQMVVLS